MRRHVRGAGGQQFVRAYWGPHVFVNGWCMPARRAMTRPDADAARAVCLRAVAQCTGRDAAGDNAFETQHLGYAAAVLVAHDCRFMGESLLDRFVRWTKACQEWEGR